MFHGEISAHTTLRHPWFSLFPLSGETQNYSLNPWPDIKNSHCVLPGISLKNNSEFHRREESQKTIGAAELCEEKFHLKNRRSITFANPIK